MSSWNHRILTNGTSYWIGEVYYNEEGAADGYTDPLEEVLGWSRLEDLITTMRFLGSALERPILAVNAKNGKIVGESLGPVSPSAATHEAVANHGALL